MNRGVLFALLGLIACQAEPQNSYSAPNGFGNGFGNNGFNGGGNGLSSGYSAPSNGFNGGFNGQSNGFGGNGRSGNGFGNGPSSGYGAPGVNPETAALAESIPGGGVPGQDYPVLSEVPETGFECRNQQVSGYYADTAGEAGCQVFHICQLRESGLVQQDSFLCPNGTIFNQQYFVCDWWFNFDCSTAESFYSLNEQIGLTQNGYGGGNGNQGSLSNGYGAPSANGFSGRTNGRNVFSNGGGNGFSGNGGYSNGGSNGFSNGGGNGFSNGGGNGYSNGGSNGFQSNGY